MKAINIDELPADAPRDVYGFPIEPAIPQAPQQLPGQSLADMTNDFKHLRGRLWAKAPKMKQQKKVAALLARMQGVADFELIMAALTEVAAHFLYIEEGEQMRPATEDEIDEEFDMNELKALTGDLTGLGPGDGSKN